MSAGTSETPPEVRREAAVRETIQRLNASATAWLAIAPVWTVRIATDLKFEYGTRTLGAFLADAAVFGWCTIEGPLPDVSPDPDDAARARRHAAETRSQVLNLVAPRVGGATLKLALDAIEGIEAPNQRARALVDLSGSLAQATVDRPDDVERATLDRAIAIAGTIERPELRGQALAALANIATGNKRGDLARAAAELVTDARPADRVSVLTEASRSVSDDQRRAWVVDLLDAAGVSTDERERGKILSGVATLVPDDLADEFGTLLSGLTSPAVQAQVYAAAAAEPRLAGAVATIARASNTMESGGPGGQPVLVSSFAAALASVGDIDGAMGQISQINDGETRGRMLGVIAGQAAGGPSDHVDADVKRLVDRAVEETQRVSQGSTVSMLGTVADALLAAGAGGEARSVLLQANAIGLDESADTVWPRVALATSLKQVGEDDLAATLAEHALRLTESTGDAAIRVEVIGTVFELLPRPAQAAALEYADGVIATCNDPIERGRLLSVVAEHLAPGRRKALLDSTLELIEKPANETTFWMPEAVRGEVLPILHSDGAQGAVRKLALEIARGVAKAADEGSPMPADLAEWGRFTSRLATASTESAAATFKAEVDDALDRRDRDRAVALTAAAASAAPSVGAELDLAVQLARRAINLNYRTEHDRARLADYLERDEQTEALETLLAATGPRDANDQWALHFLGVGGVGKTMLLRHLSVEIAERRQLDVARIDFDYINPDFPVRRPAELLAEFLGELLRYGPKQRDVRELDAAIKAYHDSLREEQPADPLEALDTTKFRDIVVRFKEIVASLGRPVVLVLDTCEELAKGEVDLERQRLPAVDATFRIMEAVHEDLPGLRVIFAGRRFLAKAGFDWKIKRPDDERSIKEGSGIHPKQWLLPDRKRYLRLHEVRGFDRDEASRYLREKKLLDDLDTESESTILSLSPELLPATLIDWDPPRDEQKRDRFNPFDLSIYAEWVRELGGTVKPGQLEQSGRDLYVERRVLGRLVRHPDVKALVPAAFLLRRFDQRMIKPAYIGSERSFTAAFRELASQEWIDLSYPAGRNTEVCEVQRGLIRRMDTYYNSDLGAADREQAEKRLADSLRESLPRSPLDALTFEEVDATLRLFKGRLTIEASSLFQSLAADLVEAADWGRIEAWTGRLSDGDGAVADPRHAMRAAVRDLRAAILVRPAMSGDPVTLGEEIRAALEREPDEAVRDWIAERVTARGLGPSLTDETHDALWEQVRTFGDRVRSGAFATPPRMAPRQGISREPVSRAEQVAAAWCAGIAGIIERADTDGFASLIDAEAVAAFGADIADLDMSADVRTFSAILAVRAERLAGPSRDGLARAVAAAASAATDATRQRWLDWQAPERSDDRAWLETVRIAAPHLTTSGERPPAVEVEARRSLEQTLTSDARLEDLAGRLESIDAERLASAILAWRLDRAPIPEQLLRLFTDREAYDTTRRPTCSAHGFVPPLFVILARGWLVAGHPQVAIDLLVQRRQAASSSGDVATLALAQAELLRVARRMRLPQIDGSLVDVFAESGEPDKVALALPVIALTRGPAPDDLVSEAAARAIPSLWWRCQALIQPERKDPVDRLRSHDTPVKGGRVRPTDSADVANRTLDAVEASWFYRDVPWQIDDPVFPHEAWAKAHPTEPDTAIALAIRASALDVPSNDGRARRLLPAPEDSIANGAPAIPAASADAMRKQAAERKRADAMPTALASVRSWAEVVGARRVAEIALEVGELMALRLPSQARESLRLATALFASSGDFEGAFIASTRQAIAAAHQTKAREPREAREEIDVAENAYRSLLRHRDPSDLPSDAGKMPPDAGPMPADTSLVAAPDEVDAVLDANPWGPWVRRYRLAYAWCRPPTTAERISGRLRPGKRRPLPTVGGSGASPVELVLDPSNTVDRGGSRLTTVVRVVILLVGLVLVLGLIRSLGDTVSTIVFGILLLGTAYALFRQRSLFRNIQASFATLNRLRLEVLERDDQGSEARSSNPTVGFTLRKPDLGPTRLGSLGQAVGNFIRYAFSPFVSRPLYRQEGDQTRGVVAFRDGPYRQLDAAMPTEIAARLRMAVSEVDPFWVPIAVACDRASARLSWESAVLLVAQPDYIKTGTARLEPYRIGRTVASTTSSGTVAALPRGRRPVTVMASSTWLSVARAGWRGPTSVATRPDEVARDHPRVLHLMGSPLDTPDGVVIALSSASVSKSAARTRADDVRIEPSHLPLADLTLIVVQGEPEPMDERRATDRERSAKLRAFGFDLHAAGASSVIVIPPLPSSLAEIVIDLVAQRLAPQSIRDRMRATSTVPTRPERADPEYSLMETLSTVRLIRQTIIEWSASHPDSGSPEPALELALDVTVFARPWLRELAMDGLDV